MTTLFVKKAQINRLTLKAKIGTVSKCRYIEIICTVPKLQICQNITPFLGLQKPLISWRYQRLGRLASAVEKGCSGLAIRPHALVGGFRESIFSAMYTNEKTSFAI